MFKVIILYLGILTISIWGIIVFIKKMIKNIRIDKNIVKLTKLASIMVFSALVLFIMAFPFILAFELTEWSKAHIIFPFLFVCLGVVYYYKNEKKTPLIIIILKYLFFWAFLITYIFFFLVVFSHAIDAEYYEQIYPFQDYTPFSVKHTLSLAFFGFLYTLSIILLIIKKYKLPPLALSFCIVFIIIGVILNAIMILQYCNITWNGYIPKLNFSDENKNYFGLFRGRSSWCSFHHIMNIIILVYVIYKIIKQEKNRAANRIYSNKILNLLNIFISRHYFIFAFIILMPVFAVVTVILQLFGQEPDSIIKVFTETTTWTFSQHEHPPYKVYEPPEGGHYLCTVAAHGHSKIVKPLCLGTRRNNTIIVNRQLQIANAYEEMIKNYFPAFHGAIRSIYDRYGYPISKKITNAFISDIVYIIMKPLEYFFLINLYFLVEKPEALIKKQYMNIKESYE